MQVVDGDLVVSPTDLTKFAACRHLTVLDLQVARGERPRPPAPGEELEMLFARGLEHEARYLARLREQGRTVVEIQVGEHPTDAAGLRALEEQTVEAMAAGAQVIYQATFYDGTWRGHADFLLRRDDLPGRWGWGYDVADTKLARRLKVPAVLQMATYAERLAILQGVDPQLLVVVTGDGLEREYRFDQCAAYARELRAQLLAFVTDPPVTAPEPVSHCGQCRWVAQCRDQWRADDDLSLVAGMRRGYARALREVGVTTLTALGGVGAAAVPSSVSRPAATRLTQQARLQLHERTTGVAVHELLAAEPDRGLALLPEPSPGDVFFDMEGDPFAGDSGLEYLFGVVRDDVFTGFWATEPHQEKAAFEQLIDYLIQAWDDDPGMHVYHYAPYEPSRLKALSGRYDTRIAEVDRLLRGERLVDLYAVVRQGLRISKDSYSIKKLEDFYWGHGRGGDGVSDALGSVVAFERWLLDRDDALLEDIRAYNEVDCRSTQALRDWLEGLRAGAGGDSVFARPENKDGMPSERLAASAQESERLRDALLHSLPEPARAPQADRSPAQNGVWLLAMLLDWHRRESLPEWSEYHQRRVLTDEDLLSDTAALAGLHSPELVARHARSVVWQMSFEPQDTKLGPGAKGWADPRTRFTPTKVLDIRPDEGWIRFSRPAPAQGVEPPVPNCTALLPGAPVQAREQEERLRELARWVVENGIESPLPTWQAARDLLQRNPVRLEGSTDASRAAGSALQQPGESAAEAVSRLARSLDGGVLPVQGPPGTGKTYAGARMVLDLIAAGKRVGVCAFSHKAVGNLLDEIASAAAQRGTALRALQKAEPEEACRSAAIDSTNQNAAVHDALRDGNVDLVAGTAWLFARTAMAGAVDVLVVDEAGQLSLANVAAISHAATDVVLLGDPQQLAQPVKGAHPAGAELSALEHLLQGRATIDPERGVLLDTTFRMHPAVADFVSWLSYDDRLHGAPELARQALDGIRLPGVEHAGAAGVRWAPVEHRGNASASSEEAEVVTQIVADALAGGHWTADSGVRRPVQGDDVLVLAPYNQQVHRIRQSLMAVPGGQGVRVGTVDKFQGQQAALVIYSLTSSSSTDAPRGVDFLLNPNRLTVAISRARAMTVLVGSPDLVATPVHTPEQLRRVNALCAFVEEAERQVLVFGDQVATAGPAPR